jgi:glutathione S-transferase
VLVVAAEVELTQELELVLTNVRDPGLEFIADSPLGKIPVLLLDDGTPLYDSRAICEYLDSLHPGRKVHPPAGPERWHALRQQALADGVADAALLLRYEGRRPSEARSPEWISVQTEKVTRGVSALAREVESFPPQPTIGTIATATALSYLDFRFPDIEWRRSQPLADWYKEFSQRPSMHTTEFRETS